MSVLRIAAHLTGMNVIALPLPSRTVDPIDPAGTLGAAEPDDTEQVAAALAVDHEPAIALTPLEAYYEQVLGLDADQPGTARMQEAVRRLMESLNWHEIEVLTDPHHVPGQPRPGRFWTEVRSLAGRGAPAAHRMVARATQVHLAEHERQMVRDCLDPAPAIPLHEPVRGEAPFDGPDGWEPGA